MYRFARKAIALFLLCCVMLVTLGCSVPVEPKKVNLTIDVKNRLDTFFSNFSEVNITPFACGTLSDDKLIEFGILHQDYNHYFTGKSLANIPADEVELAIMKFFGKVVKGEENHKYFHNYYRLENDVYQVQGHPSFGGGIHPFSQIDELWSNGDGTFTANISTYLAQDGWDGDLHGTMEDWKRTQQPPLKVPTLIEKHRATIQLIHDGDTERYILLEYLLVQ